MSLQCRLCFAPSKHNLKRIYCRQINNGVYRSGFASKQEAYDTAVRELFHGLDKVKTSNACDSFTSVRD